MLTLLFSLVVFAFVIWIACELIILPFTIGWAIIKLLFVCSPLYLIYRLFFRRRLW